MMYRPTAVVVTTIFEPAFLPGYLQEMRDSGVRDETQLFVIGDRKTPASVAESAAAARRNGFRVECPTIDEQDSFLKRLGLPTDFIPYDTDNRRNIGFLMALEQGCEVLVSIDDDNFCTEGSDFFQQHQAVGRPAQDRLVRSSDEWFNLGALLHAGTNGLLFPRGFPYFAQRRERTTSLVNPSVSTTVAMNAGLWLDEPDVDAVFRLCRQPKVTRVEPMSVVLGPDVWSPINTQNTALTRGAALTYYYVKMGYPLRGLTIDRFGDILSGYLTQKCIKHMQDGVRIGSPIVEHRRTPHNLFKDLYHELAGIVLVEEFLPWLLEERLEGRSYLGAYESLADRILESVKRFKGFIWDDGGRDFLVDMARNMKTWLLAVKRIEGHS